MIRMCFVKGSAYLRGAIEKFLYLMFAMQLIKLCSEIIFTEHCAGARELDETRCLVLQFLLGLVLPVTLCVFQSPFEIKAHFTMGNYSLLCRKMGKAQHKKWVI